MNKLIVVLALYATTSNGVMLETASEVDAEFFNSPFFSNYAFGGDSFSGGVLPGLI